MDKGYQLIPYPLRTPTWAVGGMDVISLQVLPKTHLGRIAHLAGVSFQVVHTPTFTNPPSIVQLNNVVQRMVFFDGAMIRFQAGFNGLRMKEILENGRLINPDPDLNSGSTNTFNFNRFLSTGPQNFAGDPSDFLIPCGALENAELRFTWGALADIGPDTTVATTVITPVAWLALLDSEIRIPPAYSWMEYTPGAADFNIQGRCLHTLLAMFDSVAMGAIATGDFSAVTCDVGAGQIVPNIQNAVLARAYHSQMRSGQFTPVQAEPLAATDDNPKVINGATPTALVAATANVAPIVWSPPGSRISKVAALAESALRLRWTGTQASAYLLNGRIESQPQSVVGAMAARALGSLKLNDRSAKVKTLSKDPYTGPRADFMPFAIKVG